MKLKSQIRSLANRHIRLIQGDVIECKHSLFIKNNSGNLKIYCYWLSVSAKS